MFEEFHEMCMEAAVIRGARAVGGMGENGYSVLTRQQLETVLDVAPIERKTLD